MSGPTTPAPTGAAGSRLARRLGTGDAVVLGLGSMIGAGVFAAFAPAARAAGNALLVGLLLAGAVAACNATSSAELAALHPQSGGAYVYGRARLGHVWGFLAGWGFVAGKLASCTAMALTFGRYLAPAHSRVAAAAAALAVTALNTRGIAKTALATRVVVVLVLASLAVVVAAALGGGAARAANLWPIALPGARGLLGSAALLFFAFAGYARIATLGEEVVEPRRTIPRAIPLALAIALCVYAAVGASALAVLGARRLGDAAAPLAAVVVASGWGGAEGVVRAGAALASLGVLLSLVAGVGRTMFAMASEGDLPRWLAAVHPRTRVPHRAEITVGAVVTAAALLVDLGGAIGFSSFTVLGYYAITNAAALRLRPDERLWPRGLAVGGLAGCLALAFALPLATVGAGAGVMAAGALAFALRRRYDGGR
jgi:APA family basic amino acid/polyamine antiporter